MSKRAGLCVDEVTQGGVGERAGVRKGDIIIKYNDCQLLEPSDLAIAVKEQAESGIPSFLIVFRGKEEVRLDVESGELGVVCSTVVFDSTVEGRANSKSLTSPDYPSDVPASSTEPSSMTLIDFLALIAWVVLIIGTVVSALVFFNFGFFEEATRFGRVRYFDLFGTIVAFSIFIQSVIFFALLNVIATMAREVKEIKGRVCS